MIRRVVRSFEVYSLRPWDSTAQTGGTMRTSNMEHAASSSRAHIWARIDLL